MDDVYRGARTAQGFLAASPSTAIVKFWQGIVEISLRGAIILLAFPALVSAGSASTHLSFGNATGLVMQDLEAARMVSKNLVGWVIFAAIMSMVYEGVVIALRFINIQKINDYIGVAFIADIVCGSLFALTYFAMLVAHGVYSSVIWKSLQSSYETTMIPIDVVNFGIITTSMAATAAFSFFNMALFIALCAWIAAFLFAKWQQNVTKILRSGHETSADTDQLENEE